MLKRLFIVNTDKDRSWLEIILWWEFRRILYNFLLVVVGIFTLTVFSFIVKDLLAFFPSPTLFLFWMGLFLFLANVFYTSGWIFQLITRSSSSKFINRIKPKLFIYGLLFSFGVSLSLYFFVDNYTLIRDERIKSQYADFAKKEPNFEDIVGEYVLTEISKKQLNIHDSISIKTVIRFNPDNTFEFEYFPHHGFGINNFGEYELVNATGKWEIEKSQMFWVIPMKFRTIVNISTGEIDDRGHYLSNGFRIKKHKPPHEIYISIGDPDSWKGVILQKR